MVKDFGLEKARLNRFLLPGSHDAGTFDLSEDMGPMATSLHSMIPNIVKKWSVTQSASITDQLRYGARYLDLRIAYDNKKDTFRIEHKVLGRDLAVVLDEIGTFAREHPREIILVDFRKFYNMETCELHLRFCATIQEKLGDRIAKKPLRPDSRIKSFYKRNANVLVFYHHDQFCDLKEMDPWCHDFLRNRKRMSSPWPNTTSESDLHQKHVPRILSDFSRQDPKRKRINILQCVVTPTVRFITGSLLRLHGKSNLKDMADAANKKTEEEFNVACSSSDDGIIGGRWPIKENFCVLLMDFITETKAIDICRRVTKDRCISSSLIESETIPASE